MVNRLRSMSIALVLIIGVVMSSALGAVDGTVLVDPPFGRHVRPLKVVLTREEASVVGAMEILTRELSTGVPNTARAIEWRIESAAAGSRTLELSRKVLMALQGIFERQGWTRVEKTHIVVARTQAYINAQLDSIGCYPNLAYTAGIHLMGETVCGHRVIVINLTGYLFLRSAGSHLVLAMESLPEPPMRTISYRIADRNISGLAHEWAHVARASATGELVGVDEPAWFREGFAEMLAGLARVQAFSGRMSYLDFHVIRLRKFAQWESACKQSLASYRATSRFLGGCEYYVGVLGVELLLARYGGLASLFKLFEHVASGDSFFTAFRDAYGISLSTFERIADRYVRGIRDIGTDVS